MCQLARSHGLKSWFGGDELLFSRLRACSVLYFQITPQFERCLGNLYCFNLKAFLWFAQGGKKSKSAGEGLLQWECEREKVLQALIQLFQLDIRSLWSLSLVEEEFIRWSAEST